MHFFFLLRGATWYYNAIYIIFTYSALFVGYEGDILEVISNLHIQGVKYGGKKEKFGRKSFKKLNFAEFTDFVWSSPWGSWWQSPYSVRPLSTACTEAQRPQVQALESVLPHKRLNMHINIREPQDYIALHI